MGFVIEILAFIAIFLLLKRIWNHRVKNIMGQIVVGINVFACFLYMYGIVAIIIQTLFTLDRKTDE